MFFVIFDHDIPDEDLHCFGSEVEAREHCEAMVTIAPGTELYWEPVEGNVWMPNIRSTDPEVPLTLSRLMGVRDLDEVIEGLAEAEA